jgi:uncharacterized Zn finger protein (UPF0148 family)
MGGMKISSRKEAKVLGLKTYFTGKPCKRGGVAERKLNGDCLCSECKQFRNSIVSNWIKENPKKQQAIRAKNYQKNKESIDLKNKQWKQENPSKIAKYNAKRRSVKLQSIPSWYGELDELVMEEAFDLANLRESTGIKWHIDHMIPLQAKNCCGLHCANNIQVIPEKLNVTKANKMALTEPYEWIKNYGQ